MGIISTGTFATLNCRQSWILDYTPWIPDSRYWIPVFVSGTFWILIVSGIADTLRCIPDSTSQDSGSDNKISSGFSGFHKQKFPVFRNLSDLLLASFRIKTLIIRACCMWYNVVSRRVQMTQAHHGSWLTGQEQSTMVLWLDNYYQLHSTSYVIKCMKTINTILSNFI